MTHVGKFKYEQEVIVPQFMINGNRLDVPAIVQQYMFNKVSKTWDVQVLLNGVYIILKEDRLVDSIEFWKEKNK